MEIENKTQEAPSATSTSKIAVIGKLLWCLAIPAITPYIFGFGKNHQERIAALMLITTIAFNIYTNGFFTNEIIVEESYNLEQVELLDSSVKVINEIGEFQAFNKEIESYYLKALYLVASAVSPIPFAKIGLTLLDKKERKYTEQLITTQFKYYRTDPKTDEQYVAGSCNVIIINKENFNKLHKIESYILYFNDDSASCDYAWGEGVEGVNPEGFGWAHKRLVEELAIYNARNE